MTDTLAAPTLRELLFDAIKEEEMRGDERDGLIMDMSFDTIDRIEVELLAPLRAEIVTLRTQVVAADRFREHANTFVLNATVSDSYLSEQWGYLTAAYDATKTGGTVALRFGWPIHTNASGLPDISVVCECCGSQYYWSLNDRGELELSPTQMECDCAGTAAPVEDERERLGRIVREVWVEYAEEHGDIDPSHLRGWDELDEVNREVDRRIGERIAIVVRAINSGIIEPGDTPAYPGSADAWAQCADQWRTAYWNLFDRRGLFIEDEMDRTTPASDDTAPVGGMDVHLENVKRMSYSKRTKFWDELQQRAHKGREGLVVSWPDVLLLVGPDDWEAAALSVAGEKQVVREDIPPATAAPVGQVCHICEGSGEDFGDMPCNECGGAGISPPAVADAGETGEDDDEDNDGKPIPVTTILIAALGDQLAALQAQQEDTRTRLSGVGSKVASHGREIATLLDTQGIKPRTMTPSQYRKVWDFTKRVKQSSDLTAKAAFPRIATLEGEGATLRRDVDALTSRQLDERIEYERERLNSVIHDKLSSDRRISSIESSLESRERPEPGGVVVTDHMVERGVAAFRGSFEKLGGVRAGVSRAIEAALAAQKVDQ